MADHRFASSVMVLEEDQVFSVGEWMGRVVEGEGMLGVGGWRGMGVVVEGDV